MTLIDQAKNLAAGNPRLLEWLDKVLQEKDRLPVTALFARLEAEEKSFREDVLLAELVKALTTAQRHILACAALYQIPVPLAAIASLEAVVNCRQQLQASVKLGLVEISQQAGEPYYFVSNLLDKVLQGELDEKQTEHLAGVASRYLVEQTADKRSETEALEIVRLALLGKEGKIAAEVGSPVLQRWYNDDRYREAKDWCQRIAALNDDFRILKILAQTEQRLGNGDKAFSYIERAVEKSKKIDNLGDSTSPSKDVALTAGVFADILQARGELDKALAIRQNESLPVYEKLGDIRSQAITMGQIADIYQARGELDKALAIRQNEELPVYEKLGDVRELLVGRAKLALLLQQMDAQQHTAQIQTLLCQALADARRLRIPEAGQIEGILQQLGLSCAGDTAFQPVQALQHDAVLRPDAPGDTPLNKLDIPYFSGNKQVTLYTQASLPPAVIPVDENSFLNLLLASVSLSAEEKARIISHFSELDSNQ
ncbi:MAG: hypothetical protein R3E89_19240, partial [Thiolinea sp.]